MNFSRANSLSTYKPNNRLYFTICGIIDEHGDKQSSTNDTNNKDSDVVRNCDVEWDWSGVPDLEQTSRDSLGGQDA